ncbi:MAG: chemotaxis protein methyltransferase CheR, partial [Betaproteobacteria bacterium]|nr:chemotaxis protein methyltransferase CheR [Betaproteobacteria bacterium]
MQLRSKLLQLTLQAALPPIVLCLVVGSVLVNYEREAFRRGALDRNRAFMTAVDAEIRGHMLSLSALASSQNLEADKLVEFREDAARVVKSQPDWLGVNIVDPSGRQIMNTNRAPPEKLPVIADVEGVQRVISTRQPAAASIAYSDVNKSYVVPIRVPIFRDGKVAYVLNALIKPDAFSRLIIAQRLPETWVSGLVDATGHFIARLPPRPPTDMASEDYRAAISTSAEGWYRGRTVEGKETYSAYKSSEFTKWSVGLGIPVPEVNVAAYRAASLIGFGALFTFGFALWFAFRTGRRIAAPITELVKAARLVGAGKAPPDGPAHAGIREVRDVAQALVDASNAIHEREAGIEREQSLLRAADRAKDEFLAMLGHELRNPLSAVSNAAVVLQRADLSPANRLAAQSIISRQTEQLTRLVNDLLDVGRVVAGKIRLDHAVVDLSAVTEGAVAAIKATNRSDAQGISIDCAADISVLGDRARLEQVVTNLLANAIAYTPPAGGAIDIS